ncbi:MAG: restriction endonuclease subunit S [Pontiellaceae bacterium]|nr:restriction endonuclease subunit S [Pontiellaceae bacterium]
MRKGWEKKRLGEVFKTGSGGTPLSSREEYYEGGNIPWLLSGEVAQGNVREARNFITKAGLENSAAKLFPKDTVLVAMYGATAGQVGILRFEAATNQAICGILPNEKFVPEFLFYFLLAKKDELVAQATGNAQPNISQIKIKNTEIPIPPLTEQRRIVGILDEAFAGLATAVANAEKNLQNARALFESHLNDVFTKKGEGWVDRRLDEVAADDCSLSYGIVQPGDEVQGGLPVVRPTDLTQNTITPDGLKRINPKRAESYQRTTLQGGELLLCVRGTTGVVSKAAPELAGANVTRGIVPIRFKTELLMVDFGFHLLLTESVQSQIRAKTYGAALMQINIGDLRQVSLAFPTLNEQRTIAAQLDALSAETRRLAGIYERKLAALGELKKSLLHQAFEGEL